MIDHFSSQITDAVASDNAHESEALTIAIIGGGLTGLFTATLLERVVLELERAVGNKQNKDATIQLTIFEKSRSVGRLATRYRTDRITEKNWQWSFGAQFFTAKTERFASFIAPWLESGWLQPWCAPVVQLTPTSDTQALPIITQKDQWGTAQARYISTPKMTSWGREIADQLQHTNIQFKTHVAPLAQYTQSPSTKKTELFDDQGHSLGWFDWVICTAPNVQAVELMADSGFAEQDRILIPKMLACYTLMLGWDNVQQLPNILNNQSQPDWDVAYMQNSILDRIFIEHHKPAHDELLPSVTIHARNDWSEQYVDEDIDAIKAQLLIAAKQALDWNDKTAPSQTDCHRWRYASTVIADDQDILGTLSDIEKQWIVTGDWCGRGNIESCYQSAQEVVDLIKGTIC